MSYDPGNDDDCKYAIIEKDDEWITCYVNRVSKKAYWIFPENYGLSKEDYGKEITDFKFVRWATGMDM